METGGTSASKLERLAYVAATIAGVSALLYMLGVVTLWVQIVTYHDAQDFYSASYAVAAVPQAVAASLGVKTLVDTLWAAITATYGYAVAFLGAIAYFKFEPRIKSSWLRITNRWRNSGSNGGAVKDHTRVHDDEVDGDDDPERGTEPVQESSVPKSDVRRGGWRKLFNTWTFVVLSYVVFVISQVYSVSAGDMAWNRAAGNICLLSGSYVGVWVMLQHHVALKWLSVGLVIVLASAYVSSILGAFSERPSLPVIRFWGEDVSAVAENEMFHLVAHSEEYWSVLDYSGNVLAVPRNGTEHAQVLTRTNAAYWAVLMDDGDSKDDRLAVAAIEELNRGTRFLGGIDVETANLSGVDLYGEGVQANLIYANLQHTDLYGADLREANLQGAEIQGANLECANLEGANGLEQDDLESAEGDSTTRIPRHLETPRRWSQATPSEIRDCENFWQNGQA